MGGRDSCRDLRPHSRYRALFVDDELTPDVMPRSHHSRHRRMLAVLHLDPVLRSAAPDRAGRACILEPIKTDSLFTLISASRPRKGVICHGAQNA